ncbi:DUF2846 domain-containing protein [Desulfuromonas sp. CSMB_57]|uniref:DUF2846 domain-containing protein n=1 Tax=Desulfuromonas sp. CSMB_57 TaxID=2807629 RepID=UPI001CD3E2AB|nr:DUF2846 domain-containing protein [Desulfuromonas sp. CSMB_57]
MCVQVRKAVVVLTLLALALLAGCANLGHVYQEELVPQNKGVVYIYRPSRFIGGGVSYDVKVGETPVTTLYNGGYFPYFSDPGEVEFWAKTESRSAVTLDIKAGETYFVKGTVGVGLLVGRPHLTVVPNEAAGKEIADCKLIPDKQLSAKAK